MYDFPLPLLWCWDYRHELLCPTSGLGFEKQMLLIFFLIGEITVKHLKTKAIKYRLEIDVLVIFFLLYLYILCIIFCVYFVGE